MTKKKLTNREQVENFLKEYQELFILYNQKKNELARKMKQREEAEKEQEFDGDDRWF